VANGASSHRESAAVSQDRGDPAASGAPTNAESQERDRNSNPL